MVNFLPKPEPLPLAELPTKFKKRIATLAPLRLVNDLSKVCPEVKELRPIRPDVYDQVFITDWVYRWASNDTVFFRIFKLYYQFALLRVIADSHWSFNSIWQTVLRVDDIEQQKHHIYVEDTLILNCKTIQSYEKVIPLICGPYYKLILYGNITWNQVKRLVHPGVRQIRIEANLGLHWKEYDDFAHFWFKQAHGLDYRFLYNFPGNNELLHARFYFANKYYPTYQSYRTCDDQNIFIAHPLFERCYWLLLCTLWAVFTTISCFLSWCYFTVTIYYDITPEQHWLYYYSGYFNVGGCCLIFFLQASFLNPMDSMKQSEVGKDFENLCLWMRSFWKDVDRYFRKSVASLWPTLFSRETSSEPLLPMSPQKNT